MRALVTGAASGIGRAAAERLNADALGRDGQGARLALVDVDDDALERAAASLRAAGADVLALPADLANPAICAELVDQTAAAFGGLEALISNAGMMKPASLLDLTLEDFDLAFAVNTRPTWLMAKAAFPHLRAAQGAIVATASIAAHHPIPMNGAYSASKAALLMLVRQMACDWGPAGVRVNSVSPGSTLTGMAGKGSFDPALTRPGGAPERNPLGFISTPQDQAATIAFLAGPDARFITGADVVVDGGMLTQLLKGAGRPLRQ